MMGDPLYPGADLPVLVVDNGDGHYRVTVAAEPALSIYPSFAEWKALTEYLVATRPLAEAGVYPCVICGQPADEDSAQCKRCEVKPAVRIEVKA